MPMVEYGTADVKQHFEEREEGMDAGNELERGDEYS